MRRPPILVAAALFLARSGFAQGPSPEPPGGEIQKLFFDARPTPIDEALLAGLPAGNKPEALTWRRAYTLALVRARDANRPRSGSLRPDRLAEAARALGTDDFAWFRADFLANKTFRDPAADFLELQGRLMAIENARRGVAFGERWAATIKQLVEGESAGLGQADVDLFVGSLSDARRGLAREVAGYRDHLDTLKVQLGLSAQAPVTIDVAPLAPFRENFEAIDRWSVDPRREFKALGQIAERLPSPGDVTVDGRAVLGEIEREPNRLEEVLSLASRIALQDRRDGGEAAEEVELRVRRRLRQLAGLRADYDHERQASVLAVRLLDDAFEQLIAPPTAPANPGRPGQMGRSLIAAIEKIAETRSRLVTTWTAFRAGRLALYRDLGTLPFEDWASFLGQFDATPSERGAPAGQPAGPIPPSPRPKAAR